MTENTDLSIDRHSVSRSVMLALGVVLRLHRLIRISDQIELTFLSDSDLTSSQIQF